MLTRSELTLICAALKYWGEEMTPHSGDAYSGYCDDPSEIAEITGKEIGLLRNRLATCELRYATLGTDGNLTGSQLFSNLAETEQAEKGETMIATVLVPDFREL